jgi:hypothetical protein
MGVYRGEANGVLSQMLEGVDHGSVHYSESQSPHLQNGDKAELVVEISKAGLGTWHSCLAR